MPAQHVDVALDVAQLLKDYKANELHGDKLYKGKRVRLTGKAGDIKRDMTNAVYLTVGTGADSEIPTAQCFFGEEHAARLSTIRPGQVVIVNCAVEGLMMNVLMKDCSFPSVTTYNVCVSLKNAGIATECLGAPGDLDEVNFNTLPLPSGLPASCPDGSDCSRKVKDWVKRSLGLIFLMRDDASYAAFLATADEKPLSDRHWSDVGSPSARILVRLPNSATPKLQARVKAVVDRLPPASN